MFHRFSIWFVALVFLGSVSCKHPDGNDAKTETPSSSETENPEGDERNEESSSDGDATCASPDVSGIDTVDIVEGHTFKNPVYVTQPPGASETLYVVERAGRILMVRDGEVLDRPFLDIRERVDSGFRERGLLGLAFHPNYADNGRFFIYYTPSASHRNVVAEYERASTDPPRANPEEVARLLEPKDPEDNHNGGMITFGADGYLYVGMGDGGGAGDQHGEIGNGQNIDTPFGAIHRLDVDAPDRGYAAEGNPFVGREGLDTIWAYGLRNPWRYAFDSKNGDLYIGDVGQNEFGEIDVLPAETSGGANFGWRAYEADSVYDESLTERVDDHVSPIYTNPLRSSDATLRGSCSITGGYVYRGDAIESLQGVYLFGDFCSKDVAALRYCDGSTAGPVRVPELSGLARGLSSFGVDNAGELYLVYYQSGHVKKIVPEE